ncbi:MAG: carotenoid 1,2-hydratase [Ignavibacteriae bacterium]|nr:carotenoid 1,2-hydratase [Ignavibacteriota bacterium]
MKNLLIIIYLILFIHGCDEQTEKTESGNSLQLSKAMSDDVDGNFDKAIEKRKFIFPEDHGPHPGFRTEWWYFTGNLTSEDNKQFGYQFTIFRTALNKDSNERKSEWSSNQIYMAHFAVTDISGNEFYYDERFSRNGNELAGAQIDPFKVWLEDWQINQISENAVFELPKLNIKAGSDKAEIDFDLEAIKPYILQGDSGLSQKGKGEGNASYYYSYTKLKTSGKIKIGEEEYTVNGFSWMDREWSTSALSDDQKGWDWFALQLDDSTEIMYYQMRKNDGSADEYSKGTIINSKGNPETVKKEDVICEVTDHWESPDGVKYPSGWNIKIPSKNIDLKITPAVKDQRMNVSVKYWEGAVKIEGKKNGSVVKGRGYVELTGY